MKWGTTMHPALESVKHMTTKTKTERESELRVAVYRLVALRHRDQKHSGLLASCPDCGDYLKI